MAIGTVHAEKEVLEHWKNDWLQRGWLLHDVSCKERLRKMCNSSDFVNLDQFSQYETIRSDIFRGRTVIRNFLFRSRKILLSFAMDYDLYKTKGFSFFCQINIIDFLVYFTQIYRI